MKLETRVYTESILLGQQPGQIVGQYVQVVRFDDVRLEQASTYSTYWEVIYEHGQFIYLFKLIGGGQMRVFYDDAQESVEIEILDKNSVRVYLGQSMWNALERLEESIVSCA